MSNVISFTGTVGRDAEVRSIASGQTVLNIAVANNIGFGDKQQTIWFRVALWGKRAEGSLKDYLKKGQQVFISGELTQSEFVGTDGVKKTTLEINANIVDLVGKRDSNAQPAQAQPQQAYQSPQQAYADVQAIAARSPAGLNGSYAEDNEIPF
ncbi:single-stranded DNA-binding protein [Chromatium okenii]|jgi:single-strand DNA-binding protein|uniref:single-stranded DNA-binding protein n=1 Tax=Chromatium okenii TaxID=61644 RepID=UPI0026F1B0F6|nr:single-stranded DNA-binding protein [Chromatium okenii]MBV5309283.1 single-stranded DNA-binding protein [Chromatium okenii]